MLPTGFGKSLTYESFVFGKEIIDGHSPEVIVKQWHMQHAQSTDLHVKSYI